MGADSRKASLTDGWFELNRNSGHSGIENLLA